MLTNDVCNVTLAADMYIHTVDKNEMKWQVFEVSMALVFIKCYSVQLNKHYHKTQTVDDVTHK